MSSNQPHPTVLIVDDEALFRASVADALAVELPTYQVLQAANGREALELFDAHGADVVLTDLSMPEVDGLELLLELRARRFRGAALMVTAYGSPRLEEEADRRGAFGFHEKPVDLPSLIAAIRAAAEGERSYIEGLTLAGFAQLLELERKTCRLRVTLPGRRGDLLFHAGRLADAKAAGLSGEEAASEIFSWEAGARLELHHGVEASQRTIQRPLSHLLLDSARQQDEEERDRAVRRAPSEETVAITPPIDDGGTLGASLKRAMAVSGALGAALVDLEATTCIAHRGGAAFDVASAAVGNCDVVQAELRVIRRLELDDAIEDILVSLTRQYHLIRPIRATRKHYLYLALDRATSNLALARHTLAAIEQSLELE